MAAELEALRALPRGKAPGLDVDPYEIYLRILRRPGRRA